MIHDNRGQGMMMLLTVTVIVIIIIGILLIPLNEIWVEHIIPLGIQLGTNQTQIDQMNMVWGVIPYIILLGLFFMLIIHAK